MRRYPRSFFTLALAGIAIAALPLAVALASAAYSLQRLAGQSRDALYQTALAARASRQLAEQVTAMERLARQYLVLGDAALLQSYERLRTSFRATTSELALLPLDEQQLQQLNRAVEGEQAVWEPLAKTPRPLLDAAAVLGGVVELADLARLIADQSGVLIEREVESLNARAAGAQRMMGVLLAAALPLAGALALGFAGITARPVRELDAAIRRLGTPDLGVPVRVEGPRDIEVLGERLEWLRRRLAELEEQKSKFLAHVSHELKTPLAAMREGAELIADGSAGPLNVAQRDIAGILRSNSLRLQKLVADLLSYHRATDPRAELHLEAVDVAEVIRGVLEAHRLSAEARGLRFDAHLQPVSTLADEEKLRTVVDNLVSNAVNFSPDRGTISLTLAAQGNNVAVDVSDGGAGVPAEDRERIFDWFFQGRTASAGRMKGSGLGLAIARECCLALGGGIEVLDSASGAHFRVLLPLHPVPGGA
ncbi:MAG TPA: ATP-binding protein [Burkholderiales bacterium]